LFTPDDPAACAAALAALLANRSTWEARKSNALAHVRSNHDWAANAQRYQDIYQRLLTPKVERSASLAA
jgi:glycosyltransferase involved in cell wall biosynthesis